MHHLPQHSVGALSADNKGLSEEYPLGQRGQTQRDSAQMA